MLIKVLGVKTYTKIWRLLVILIKLKHSFLHPTTNTCYNSVIPEFIHHPGCVINRKISFKHGEVGITWSINFSLRQRSNYFFEFLLF